MQLFTPIKHLFSARIAKAGYHAILLGLVLAVALALSPEAIAGGEWWKELAGKKYDTGGGVLSFKLKEGKLRAEWVYSVGGGGNMELGPPKVVGPRRLLCEYQDGDLKISFNKSLRRVKLEGTPFNPNASPVFAEGREKWQLRGKGLKLGSLSLDSAGRDAWWTHLLGNKYDMGDSTLKFERRDDKFSADWDYVSGGGESLDLSNFVAYEGNALVCDYQNGEITFHFSPDLGEVEVTSTSYYAEVVRIDSDGVLTEGNRLALKKKAPAGVRAEPPQPASEPEPTPAAAPVEAPQDEPGAAGGGGGETLAEAGHMAAPEAPSAVPSALPENWWRRLGGRAYRLDNGQVMKFVMQGRLLTLEWGKLVFSRAGSGPDGSMRLICLNCSAILQAGLGFNRDLETMRADMGRLGNFTGIYAGEAADFAPLGPQSD